MLQQRTSVWRHFDFWLLAAVLLLTAYGIVMIRSAISGADEFIGYEMRQVQFAAVGLVALFVIAAIDYRIFTSGHWYIYAGFIGLLLVVAAIGTIGNEARRWISLGSFNLQPTELGRIFFAITFAQFLAQRQPLMNRFSNTILSGVYLAVPIVLIFLQPDLGMSILFSFMWLIMLIMAGLPPGALRDSRTGRVRAVW